MNFKKFRNLATLATGSFSALLLAVSPAFALTFAFCGTFDTGSIIGGMVNGKIRVTDDGTFDNFAKIRTEDSNGSSVRTYTEEDFVDRDIVDHPTQGFDAFKYTFEFDGASFPDNRFEVYLPVSIFPTIPGQDPDLSDFEIVEQFEVRGGIVGKDPDDLTVARTPEPMSLLGTTIAIGLGGMLTKGNLKKLQES